MPRRPIADSNDRGWSRPPCAAWSKDTRYMRAEEPREHVKNFATPLHVRERHLPMTFESIANVFVRRFTSRPCDTHLPTTFRSCVRSSGRLSSKRLVGHAFQVPRKKHREPSRAVPHRRSMAVSSYTEKRRY